MSSARLASLALAALAAGCAGLRTASPPAGPARPAESFALAGTSVAIHDPAGQVRVQPGAGPDVRVEVTRFGADADRLRAEHQARASGDILRIRVEGPASRRLRYPALPGRSDSLQFRATRAGFAAGRGGFLGLFGGRSTKVVRSAGKAPSTEAHADLVVSVPPGRRVDLHVGAGEVRIAGEVGELHAQSVAGDFDLDSTGGRIFVSANAGGVFVRAGSGELTIASRVGGVDVAQFTGRRLEATTSAGTIRGQGLSAHALRLRAGAGGIDVSGGRAVVAELRTGSGRLLASDLVADTLSATTEVGDLALSALRAGVATVRVRKGDLVAGLAAVPSRLSARGDGAAVLELPSGAAADLVLSSEHGRVTVQGPEAQGVSATSGGRSLTTRLGAGGGQIEVRAEHDIVLRLGPTATAEREAAARGGS